MLFRETSDGLRLITIQVLCKFSHLKSTHYSCPVFLFFWIVNLSTLISNSIRFHLVTYLPPNSPSVETTHLHVEQLKAFLFLNLYCESTKLKYFNLEEGFCHYL